MPLIHGKSKKALGKNISAEMHAGKPQKQALAIAFSVQRKAKKAKGGLINAKSEPRANAYAQGGTVTAPQERMINIDAESAPARNHQKHPMDVSATHEGRPSVDHDNGSRSHIHRLASGQEIDLRAEGLVRADEAMDSRESPNGPVGHHMQPTAHDDTMVKAASGGIADMIRARKKYAEGGQVDLSENADEDKNLEDDLSFEALKKENYSESEGLKDLDYDTSRSVGHDLPDEDEHSGSLADKIRKKSKK